MFLFVFPSGPLSTNAVLLGCTQTKSAAVIDPALGSTDMLIKTAEKHQFRIEKILLTHSHFDHIAEVYELKKRTGAKIFIHTLDAPNLIDPGSDGIPLMFPVQGVSPDVRLEDGQKIEVGNLSVQVMHTPGHSPGSVCYYIASENTLFSGDTFFKGSMGVIHFPTGNAENMWESLKKLSKLPPKTKVVPGHGVKTTIGDESWLSQAKEMFF